MYHPFKFCLLQRFFHSLLQRIQVVGRKKISCSQCSIPHPDLSLPHHKLTKYTYHIYNLNHLKSIFNTPFISLQSTRSFLVNRNGTYQAFQPPESPLQTSSSSCRGPNTSSSQQPLLIRPHEFRTVLRVGSSASQPICKPCPFTIEWTPNVLPISKMGELRLKFDFEHIHNGQLVKTVSLRDVMPALHTADTAINNNNSLTIPVLPTPIILSTSSIVPSAAAATVSTSKASTSSSNKQTPTPIAPKIVLPLKDTAADDAAATSNILGITLPHDFVDTEGYTTLHYLSEVNL